MPILTSITQDAIIPSRYIAVSLQPAVEVQTQAVSGEASSELRKPVTPRPQLENGLTADSFSVLVTAQTEAMLENRQIALSAAAYAYTAALGSGTTPGSVALFGLSA